MGRIIKKPEERRREIISVSRDLFLHKGYENTTMQDVMLKLGIAKGTTYHYFKSKEQLLHAVVEDMVSEYMARVENTLKSCKGNALEKMHAIITAGMVATRLSDTINSLHCDNNRVMHMLMLAVTFIKLAPLYARVISQGCMEGFFQVEHPLECAEIMLAGIQFVTDVGCYPWSQEDLERRIRAIPSFIENQLHASSGAFSSLCNFNNKKS